jgi:phage terminase large subunit-like protein
VEFYFDEAAADHACEFFERYLRHAKGEWAGQLFTLAEWQKEQIIRPLFGWKRADGTRRYRTVYIEVPRKNGKTTLLAGIGLYLLILDGEPGAEIYSAAGDKEQARLTFDLAKSMVEAEPKLRKRCKVYRNSIVCSGSTYKVISADAGTKHGFSAHGILFDELHVQRDRELWDTLRTSVGARRQPVTVAITTAGVYDPESICWEQHKYARGVLDGTIEDDSFLAVIYAADPADDYREPSTWAKANPGLGVSVKLDYLAAEAARAAAVPSYENTFRQLHLNQWTQQATRWIKLEHWSECAAQLPDLSNALCYGGLDLSTTTDLSAFVLAFPGDPIRIIPHFWIPEAKLSDRGDRVPYDAWKRAGYLTVTPGDVVDYDRIRADINELGRKYNIAEIRFDPWNATQLAGQLGEQDGFQMTQMRQGFVSMSAPAKEFERLVVGGLLEHGDSPVLNWMIGNVAVKVDPSGNIKPDKSKSAERIDGVVAAIMALSGVTAGEGGPSIYQQRGLLMI